MSLKNVHHLRKFYQSANVVVVAPGQFGVCLDTKGIKSESGRLISTPFNSIAHVIQNEFNCQKDYLISQTMPMVALSVQPHANGNRL